MFVIRYKSCIYKVSWSTLS